MIYDSKTFQVNIEVKLDKKQVDNLKEFVRHLSHTMHSSIPGSLVIWSFHSLNSKFSDNITLHYTFLASCISDQNDLQNAGMML